MAKTKMVPSPGFETTAEIDVEKIRNLLCCAFEGGSNYWYMIDKAIYPPGFKSKDYGEGGKGQNGPNYWHWAELLPTQEGGALIISSKEGDEINGTKTWRLDREAIQHGLKIMAEECPQHYGNFLSENEDAITGDVFLQCCLFGEIVYG